MKFFLPAPFLTQNSCPCRRLERSSREAEMGFGGWGSGEGLAGVAGVGTWHLRTASVTPEERRGCQMGLELGRGKTQLLQGPKGTPCPVVTLTRLYGEVWGKGVPISETPKKGVTCWKATRKRPLSPSSGGGRAR